MISPQILVAQWIYSQENTFILSCPVPQAFSSSLPYPVQSQFIVLPQLHLKKFSKHSADPVWN